MISDLLTLRKELLASASDKERKQRDAAFRTRVEAEIRLLFADPKYESGRRSLMAIRKRLGVFGENDPELRAILFDMGALVYRGEGESALYEMPEPADAGVTVPQRKKVNFTRFITFFIFVAIALVVMNVLISTLTGQSIFNWLQSLFATAETIEDCLKTANAIMEEIIKCNQKHG